MNHTMRIGLSILGAAILLGVLGDVLLRVTPWGINVVLWFATLMVILFALARGQDISLSGGGRWLIMPALLLVFTFAFRDSWTLTMWSAGGLLIALALVASRTRAGRVVVAGLTEYVVAPLMACLYWPFGLLDVLFNRIKWSMLPRGRWSTRGTAVARGVIIVTPLLFLFGGLFVAADAVFQDMVEHLFDWDISNLFDHTLQISFWALVSGGFLYQTLLIDDNAETQSSAARPLQLGTIEVFTALSALNILFFVFVLVQLGYFFGGVEYVQRVGLTYSEYARRGFFELVAVAALLLLILLSAHWLLGDANGRRNAFRWLAGAMIAMMFVIMGSALYRMGLYTDEFGLTELRLYTTAFMGWLALVFVWFALTVLRGHRERFAFGALIAGFIVIGALHLINPDDLIVRVNTTRDTSRPLDVNYLINLSADAVPALIDSLSHMGPDARCAVMRHLLKQLPTWNDADWRTFNYSRWRAASLVSMSQQTLIDACPYP